MYAEHLEEKRGDSSREAHDQNRPCDVASGREVKLQTVRGLGDEDSMVRWFGNLGGYFARRRRSLRETCDLRAAGESGRSRG